jgi:16S rRNA (adenine1518-N6/adenine1519-N6)-dimethyltransferase
MQAKKSLGQNFLTSVGAINKIIASSDYSPNLTILEVGPGRGVLTEALLKKFERVVAVEKDHELIGFLREKFSKEIESGQLRLVEGDILELKPSELELVNYGIVANIPYYITGQFLRIWLSIDPQPKYMVLMVQKEVAKRVVASDEKESLLSMSVKLYGVPKYIETIKRGSFYPIPNVDSAILKIGNILKPETSEENFFTLLKAGFAHKRKLLLSNLKESGVFGDPRIVVGQPTSKFDICHIDSKARAEDLKLEDWLCLVESI